MHTQIQHTVFTLLQSPLQSLSLFLLPHPCNTPVCNWHCEICHTHPSIQSFLLPLISPSLRMEPLPDSLRHVPLNFFEIPPKNPSFPLRQGFPNFSHCDPPGLKQRGSYHLLLQPDSHRSLKALRNLEAIFWLLLKACRGLLWPSVASGVLWSQPATRVGGRTQPRTHQTSRS